MSSQDPTKAHADPSADHPVRCEVTGDYVAADEIVNFMGMRVSSVGKQMLLDKIKSGERLPNETPRPTFMNRLGALIADALVILLGGSVLFMLLTVVLAYMGNPLDRITVDPDIFLLPFLYLLYTAYESIMYSACGKTVGKMHDKMKVVRSDLSDITIGRALLRSIAKSGPMPLALVFIVVDGCTILFWTDAVIVSMLILTAIYWLADAVFVVADGRAARSLHDIIAGTRVIIDD